MIEIEEELREMTERHVTIATRLQAKALEALEEMEVCKMQPREILAFLKEAVSMERCGRAEREEARGSMSLADVIINAYRDRQAEAEAETGGSDA